MSPETQGAVRPAPTPRLLRFEGFDSLFGRVQKQMERIAQRAFQSFEQRGRLIGHDLEDWMKAESELFQPVPVEIEEKGNQLVIRADVPGFKDNELDIGLEPTHVVITGKSETTKEERERGKILYSEQRASEICRCVALPQEVNPEQASAVLKDGRLEIIVTKAESKKEKKIPVKAA